MLSSIRRALFTAGTEHDDGGILRLCETMCEVGCSFRNTSACFLICVQPSETLFRNRIGGEYPLPLAPKQARPCRSPQSRHPLAGRPHPPLPRVPVGKARATTAASEARPPSIPPTRWPHLPREYQQLLGALQAGCIAWLRLRAPAPARSIAAKNKKKGKDHDQSCRKALLASRGDQPQRPDVQRHDRLKWEFRGPQGQHPAGMY